MFHKALLGKWLWRYATENESLWRRVIDSKYGSMWGGWCSHSHLSVWSQPLEIHKSCWNTFSNYISYMVGDGSHIKFWHAPWCGDQPLKMSFPELYSLARNPEATVANTMQIQGSSIHWDAVFIRAVKDWELEVVVSFLDLLYSCSITRGGLDSFHWTLSRSMKFDVKSFYKDLLRLIIPPFRGKVFGRSKFQPKLLSSLGQRLWDLWDMVFTLSGACWVMPKGVEDLLACWAGRFGKGEATSIWKIIPHCLMWKYLV
uniref:Reverse transcriptase zinc-binding domain-containing protein n=1 Tax=Fagus sylvatica TaxID=28930 RepID=A0A2N9FAS9_FAGSY